MFLSITAAAHATTLGEKDVLCDQKSCAWQLGFAPKNRTRRATNSKTAILHIEDAKRSYNLEGK
jgi:hypothetical protein